MKLLLELLMNINFWHKSSQMLSVAGGALVVLGTFGAIYFGNILEKRKDQQNQKKITEVQARLEDKTKKIKELEEKLADRIITPANSLNIISVLKIYGEANTKALISVTNNDRESVGFAEQVKTVFQKAEWNVQGPIIAMVPTPFKGVAILIKDQNKQPPGVKAVVTAFEEILNIELEKHIDKKLQENEIKILIGSKSN